MENLVRKTYPKWSASEGLDPNRSGAGSHWAPSRWPERHRAAKKLITRLHSIREWIDEWAEGGAVIGEPSTSLGGSLALTLVPRERKRRDSNRGLVITTALRSCVDSRMSA